MSSVCLDTMILVWGIQNNAKPTQQAENLKAISLIDKLDKQKTKIIIPTIVLGEYLVRIPPEHHLATANQLNKRFQLIPFDAQCAQQFANLWRANEDRLAELYAMGSTRKLIKADCMILATAIVRGVDCIYSHDPHLEKLSQGYIEIRKMPEAAAQLPMF